MDDIAFVALGSNVGDRDAHLAQAIARISCIPSTHIIATTIVEQTAPLGPIAQDHYLNQMIALRTTLAPEELLRSLQAIELAGGRTRSSRWGPRTIDLDIVKYAATSCDSPELKVPHAELDNRDFWQRELAELEQAIN
ncbi:MAG: 2-amino-4-hydroxy-6-hydroxymethyldihydropteridine diphosphokinase [Gemmatimonadota bacterium]|nr:2-amino-4-hydroxy-6-hydroxymethyldihydropteridine diphosphokinase [Gemmatimonadota bacterium]